MFCTRLPDRKGRAKCSDPELVFFLNIQNRYDTKLVSVSSTSESQPRFSFNVDPSVPVHWSLEIS